MVFRKQRATQPGGSTICQSVLGPTYQLFPLFHTQLLKLTSSTMVSHRGWWISLFIAITYLDGAFPAYPAWDRRLDRDFSVPRRLLNAVLSYSAVRPNCTYWELTIGINADKLWKSTIPGNRKSRRATTKLHKKRMYHLLVNPLHNNDTDASKSAGAGRPYSIGMRLLNADSISISSCMDPLN